MRSIVIVLLSMALVGCSLLSQITLQTKESSIAEINAQCLIIGDPFYIGAIDRIWDKKQRRNDLTPPQYRDIEEFKKFCSLDPEKRDMKDYGYWAGGEGKTVVSLIMKGIKIAGGMK